MKSWCLNVAFPALCSSLVIAQVGLNSSQISSSSASLGIINQSRVSQSRQIVSLVGKVTAEDGTPLSTGTVVAMQCGSSERARVNADGSGDFSMSISVIEDDPGTALNQTAPGAITSQEWNQCELYGEAPGYISERLRLFGAPGVGVVRAGTVIMHPMARTNDSGPSVSVASLAAPEKAKKAFEHGQEQEKKGKWTAAYDYFKKAVEVYPRYAIAWLELGRTQMQQNDFSGAQQSFHQAAQEDPRFIDAYVQIANIAIEKRQWKELADSTEHIVQLAPEATPKFWFLNSAANFNLGNIPQAETSATRGLRMDSRHEVPQLEYLYGLIMARRGDYNSAILHLQNYVRLSPQAKDIPDAQAKLAELQKLAGAQTTASR